MDYTPGAILLISRHEISRRPPTSLDTGDVREGGRRATVIARRLADEAIQTEDVPPRSLWDLAKNRK
ncbi:MAG: hypothetical protein LBT00_15305 [Spirochaetaceae bacterium]|nr:hypothetical protein [Spirochaetaceae bacterium]